MPPCLNQDNPERITDPGRFGSLEERLDALLLEQLPALADAARDRGVILLIEPVNREETEYLTSVDHAARLVAKANHPALGCTADFFHMQIEGHGMAEEIERSAAFIRHVHVASITRVEPGPGPLDFNPGFRALKAAGYAGWLEVECRKLSGPPDEVLPKSADYLRQTWRTA